MAALDIDVAEYRHRVTGAMHFHFAAEHTENVFMVAFRTLPEDSTGVAHVLEHTVLCGSERYPVRDPFFLMIRRSLNTFMNAFTGSDYTAYPFASQNPRDFDNLLDIYLDAVFFPRLDPLDFAQEGHRIEFEESADASTRLVHRGVVYNEMKGDASSPHSVAYEALTKHLFPTTTYHFNSGGDPAEIPNLTYEGLRAFYERYYHPSNAIFMTFGDRPVAELHETLEAAALGRYRVAVDRPNPGAETRYQAPIRAREPIAVSADEADRGQVLFGWLLGPSTDVDAVMRAELLSDLLLDTSASPLRAALEQTSLGSAPSALCGLEETSREMYFMCGLEGVAPEHAGAVEALVMETLGRIAREGLEAERVAAVLHQIELHRREVGGDGYPYGLQLMFSALPAAVHGGDPIALLDLEQALGRLREEVREPGFVQSLARNLLVDNPHRVRVTLEPDEALTARLEAGVEASLADTKAAMSDAERTGVVDAAARLAERQARPDDVDLLPKVGRGDVPLELRIPAGDYRRVRDRNITQFGAGTNGLAYEQAVFALPELLDGIELLPVLGATLSEVGSGGRGFAATQHLQHSVCGGITAYASIRAAIDDPDRCAGLFVLSSRALRGNAEALAAVLEETVHTPDYAEAGRLEDLLQQLRVRRDSGITGNGHGLAMTAAAAAFSRGAALNHHLSGLKGILALREMDADLTSGGAEALAARLGDVTARIAAAPRQLLLVAEPERVGELADRVVEAWSPDSRAFAPGALVLPDPCEPSDQIWLTNTQVSFCAQAHPTVPENHPDSAALAVLGGVLRNAYLHAAVRERGGAYGVGAGNDGANGVFRLYSYRDPNLEATFDEFDRSIEWAQSPAMTEELVEEAVLQIVSSIDAPASPAGEARMAFLNGLHGRDADARRRVRSAILEVTASDVQRVAASWLGGASSRCAVTGTPLAGDRYAVFEV